MNGYVIRKGIRPLPGMVIKGVKLPEPNVIEGFGSRKEVGEICRKAGYTRVLLVTDATLHRLGHDRAIADSLAGNSIECAVFADIASEPTSEVIEAGRKAALDCGAQCIVGLGGGSVMDSCKMIAAGARLKHMGVRAMLLKFLPVPGETLPIINIPSTAGTGAEITVGAVVTDSAKQRKGSTVIMGLNVTDVILDSELTVKMPRGITAACGIDALSHGLEGLIAAVRSSEEDIMKSLECVRIVLEDLPKVLENPDDIDARQRMCLAAHYGGNAINRQLAGYVHAFAHSIGARYHIPHGNAIALCLLPVVEAEMPHCVEDLAETSYHCSLASRDVDSPEVAARKLMEALDGLTKLCEFPAFPAIPEEDIPELVRAIDLDSINYSAPVTLTDGEIISILKKL